jgi:cation diffusion facilitator family transporter
MAMMAPMRRFWQLDIASRAAVLSLGSNALLMALKITIGLLFGSVAVLGDGIDSAEDVIASGIAFFTVRLSLQPADDAHPYGHGKAESLAALSQAALIAGGAVFIAVTAVRRLAIDDTEIVVLPSLIAMGITVTVNFGVMLYAFHAARVSQSVAIAADARHLSTNIVQAATVIAGLALVGITGTHSYDQIVALLLAVYLGWIALGIFRVSLHELIDSALPPADVARLEACLQDPAHGIRGFHDLRTRKSGRDRYVDLHALVDPALTVSEAHRLMEEIEAHIHEAMPGATVTIHLDPDEPGIMERGRREPTVRDEGLHLHSH